MARPRSTQSSAQQLSPGQASYVVERLIGDRRLSAGEINGYVADMHREIGDLERRLESLRSVVSGGGSGAATASAPRRGRPPGRPARRGPGRPPGSGRGPGRPAASASTSSADAVAASPAPRRRRRRRAITAEQLASRQLQGRYLGLIRQIPARKRGHYQRIAKERGREAAIREIRVSLKK